MSSKTLDSAERLVIEALKGRTILGIQISNMKIPAVISTYDCPLNDHSGSKGVGLPRGPNGQSMLTVASMVAKAMRRLFSAKLLPIQMLHGLLASTYLEFVHTITEPAYRLPNPKLPTGNGSPFPP